MVQDQPTISGYVKAFYEHHRAQTTRPILDDLTEALKLEIGMYSKVFIVVDALDECEQNEARAILLRTLRSLTAGNVQLMLTSRDLPSIAEHFQMTTCLDIRANDGDVRRYLEGRIATAPQHLKRLQGSVVSELIQNAGGM